MPKVETEITVEAPADKVYRAWHNFENFPRFMDNIEDVRVVGGNRSHWKAKGPLGADADWDAEMTLDEPGRAIGWRSIDGNQQLQTAGRVNFEPVGEAATQVSVVIQYDAPGGAAGNVVTQIFSNPENQIAEDLRRFKEVVESQQGFEQGGP
jgi:uncharacterized membrane protein